MKQMSSCWGVTLWKTALLLWIGRSGLRLCSMTSRPVTRNLPDWSDVGPGGRAGLGAAKEGSQVCPASGGKVFPGDESLHAFSHGLTDQSPPSTKSDLTSHPSVRVPREAMLHGPGEGVPDAGQKVPRTRDSFDHIGD